MENIPTAAQLERRARNGEVTGLHRLDPRDTSSETLYQVRVILQALGHIARENIPNRL